MRAEEVYELKFIPNELKRSIAYYVAYSHIRKSLFLVEQDKDNPTIYSNNSSGWWVVGREMLRIKIKYFFKNDELYYNSFFSYYIYNGVKWVDIRIPSICSAELSSYILNQ